MSDAPPTLLVCINRGASSYPAFSRNPRLCVNLLAARHRALAETFGRRPLDERFLSGAWRDGRSGVPILEDALISFECRIVRRVSAGTHDVLFCEVEALAGGGGNPLVYGLRRYHALNPEEEPEAMGRPVPGKHPSPRPPL